MEKTVVRIVINNDTFRKYKVFCAIQNISMTDQTNILVKEFVDEKSKEIKIINTEKKQ